MEKDLFPYLDFKDRIVEYETSVLQSGRQQVSYYKMMFWILNNVYVFQVPKYE